MTIISREGLPEGYIALEVRDGIDQAPMGTGQCGTIQTVILNRISAIYALSDALLISPEVCASCKPAIRQHAVDQIRDELDKLPDSEYWHKYTAQQFEKVSNYEAIE